MKIKNPLFVSHEEAIHICDKNQYGEASILELIKLNLRMIHCKVTRSYSKKNSRLTKILQNTEIVGFTVSEKNSIKTKITNLLSK